MSQLTENHSKSDRPLSQERKEVPLCVDLDGTIHVGDFFVEALVRRAAGDPLGVLFAMAKGGGPAKLKEMVHCADEEAADYFYPHPEVEAWLRKEKETGREIYLVTAAHRRVADSIARALPVFAGVFATEGGKNLKGENKRRLLEEKFGKNGYDFAGDSVADHPALESAREKWWVDRTTGSLHRIASSKLPAPSVSWSGLLGLLRPHQWSKNLLVLVPLLASGQLFNTGFWKMGGLAVLAWCMISSAGYILNDMLDVAHDRRHSSKCRRPIAAGKVMMSEALVLFLLTLFVGAGIACFAGVGFAVALGGYFVLSIAYSLALKKIAIFDILALALLYVMRVIGGGLAMDIQISSWLLMFVTFGFFGMAALKRQAELVISQTSAGDTKGRDYRVSDLPAVSQIALTGMGLAGLVLAMYARSPEALLIYRHPERLMILSLLWLAWSAYLVFWAGRGEIKEDPVKFCLKDRTSHVLLCIGIAAYFWAR